MSIKGEVDRSPRGPGLVRCIRAKRELFYEFVMAHASGAASLEEIEAAADELAAAKENLRKATGGTR